MTKPELTNFFYQMQGNPEANLLKLENNSIIYNEKVIDLSDFNLTYFLQNNPKFLEDLPTLSAKTIFNVIKLHAEFTNNPKISQEESQKYNKNPQEQLTLISEKFPVLKNFKILSNINIDERKSYIYYIDSNKNSHLIPDVDIETLIKSYHDLVIRMNREITAEELFQYLITSRKENKLESMNEAKMRNNAGVEHINNLEMLTRENKQTGNTLDTPVGNEDEKIYISNKQIYTFDFNEDNQVVKTNHEIRTDTNDISKENPKLNEEKIIEEERITLLTFQEYSNLILNHQELSNEEKNQINVYESFLFDIITYKDYLTEELYQVYNDFNKFLEYIYQLQSTTQTIEDAKKRYIDMQDRSEKVEITNQVSKVAKLTRMNQDSKKAGEISILAYFIAVLIALGVIIIIYLLIK